MQHIKEYCSADSVDFSTRSLVELAGSMEIGRDTVVEYLKYLQMTGICLMATALGTAVIID